jgi:anthranilate synthase/indole-3-glycerol phosphate synthase/phosphoribosylanthranilate isomerase
VVLAGGLNPDNVAKAISETGLGVFAVDVSSGVEVQGGGRKDADKVRAFVNNAKSA